MRMSLLSPPAIDAFFEAENKPHLALALALVSFVHRLARLILSVHGLSWAMGFIIMMPIDAHTSSEASPDPVVTTALFKPTHPFQFVRVAIQRKVITRHHTYRDTTCPV